MEGGISQLVKVHQVLSVGNMAAVCLKTITTSKSSLLLLHSWCNQNDIIYDAAIAMRIIQTYTLMQLMMYQPLWPPKNGIGKTEGKHANDMWKEKS